MTTTSGRPLRRAVTATATGVAVVVAVLAGCSAPQEGGTVPTVPPVQAGSPATASAGPSASRAAPTTATPVAPSVAPTRSFPPDTTPTTSSAPRITTGQTQPPGAVVILPIKDSDRSPATARAIDTAASYLEAVAGVYRAGGTSAITRLSTNSCASCDRDIRVLGGRIDRGEKVIDASGLETFKFTELKYIGTAGRKRQVSADVIEGPARLVNRAGKTLIQQRNDTAARYIFTIVESAEGAKVESFTVTSQ